MSIQGVTFDLQPLTAAFDGALHAYLLTDGVLRGCEVTYSGYDVYVSPGQFIAAGRLVHIPERTRIFGSSIFESASIQIKFTIDLNNTASAAEFTQGRFASAWVSTSSGDTFPALVQEDINVSTGRKYEVEFARATTDASRLLTSATRTLRAADLRLAASGGGGTGADGRTPELRLGKTAIEWRYVGDAAWQTLVPLADITGPQGPQGARGATGATGPQGPSGQGIPAGGATGQILVKRSGADYDTNWATPTSGSGGTPDAHASTHAAGGSDPITPALIGAATSGHNHTGTYAPISHAATATTYGKATSTSYGHVKLSSATNSASGLSDGTAATPSAVKAAYDLAAGKADADHNHDDRYALIGHTHSGSGAGVEYITITAPLAGWDAGVPCTQTISVAGVAATDYITAKYTSNAINTNERVADHAAYCCVTDGTPTPGGVLLTCWHERPTRDIRMVLRVEHGGTTGYMVMTGQARPSGGAKTANGSVIASEQAISVTGLGFKPSMVTFIGSSGKTTVTSGYGADTGSTTIARYADASNPDNVGTFSPSEDGFVLTVQGAADPKSLNVSWYAVGD